MIHLLKQPQSDLEKARRLELFKDALDARDFELQRADFSDLRTPQMLGFVTGMLLLEAQQIAESDPHPPAPLLEGRMQVIIATDARIPQTLPIVRRLAKLAREGMNQEPL